jgi:hypothetical protein
MSVLSKKAKAGRKGGQKTFELYGTDHMKKIGANGAATTWKRYGLKPVGTSQFAMVNRETNEVKAFLTGLPFKR